MPWKLCKKTATRLTQVINLKTREARLKGSLNSSFESLETNLILLTKKIHCLGNSLDRKKNRWRNYLTIYKRKIQLFFDKLSYLRHNSLKNSRIGGSKLSQLRRRTTKSMQIYLREINNYRNLKHRIENSNSK